MGLQHGSEGRSGALLLVTIALGCAGCSDSSNALPTNGAANDALYSTELGRTPEASAPSSDAAVDGGLAPNDGVIVDSAAGATYNAAPILADVAARCNLPKVLAAKVTIGVAGFSQANALFYMWLADAAYSTEFAKNVQPMLTQVGFSDSTFIDHGATGLQAILAQNGDEAFVIFRGSQELRDWITNFDFFPTDGTPYGLAGKVHKGFASSLDEALGEIQTWLAAHAPSLRRLRITGHSLGGALAALAAARFATKGRTVAEIYTFGQPRVGDLAFAAAVEQASYRPSYFRVVDQLDFVAYVPPTAAGADKFKILVVDPVGFTSQILNDTNYQHAGTMMRVNPDGFMAPVPLSDDALDADYWDVLSRQFGTGGMLTMLLKKNGEHLQASYLCGIAKGL